MVNVCVIICYRVVRARGGETVGECFVWTFDKDRFLHLYSIA